MENDNVRSETENDLTETQTEQLSEENSPFPEDFNPYDGMLERLQKLPNARFQQTHQDADDTEAFGKKMTPLLKIVVLVVLWLFTLQFFPFKQQDEYVIINAEGIFVSIILTVIVIIWLVSALKQFC